MVLDDDDEVDDAHQLQGRSRRVEDGYIKIRRSLMADDDYGLVGWRLQ